MADRSSVISGKLLPLHKKIPERRSYFQPTFPAKADGARLEIGGGRHFGKVSVLRRHLQRATFSESIPQRPLAVRRMAPRGIEKKRTALGGR